MVNEVRLPEPEPKPNLIGSVNSFFSDLNGYDRMFSAPSIAARLFISPSKSGDFAIEEKVYQDMQASVILYMHEPTLNSVGLSIEPVTVTGMIVMVQGEEVAGTELRINMKDHKRFIPFLRSLEPEQIVETGLKPNLENLSRILAEQILTHYDLSDPPNEELELFAGLGKIVKEYDRLGMELAVRELKICLIHLNDKNLATYVNFKRKQQLGLFKSGNA